MEDTRERLGSAGVAVLGFIFKVLLYACVLLLIFWAGKTSYNLSYNIFNQKAMSPGEGKEISVVIPEGTSVYEIGKTLESKGLVESALVFFAQEMLSNYHGQLQPGTFMLSTAYTPDHMMAIMAGAEPQGGTAS